MEYRNLTEQEILILTENMCVCNNWSKISVKDGFQAQRVRKVRFDGNVKLGNFSKTLTNSSNIEKPTGIYHSRISNCEVADNVYISNINNMVNYIIEEDTMLENINTLVVTKENSFGVGKEIEVLNEGGGREMPLLPNLSSQLAYIIVSYKNDVNLQKKLSSLCEKEKSNHISSVGKIGKGVKISNVKEITNVNVGNFTKISNATSLSDGTIVSSKISPVFVGANVVAKNFIILSGTKVDTSVNLDNCFVGESTELGKQFSAENSAFFANCEGFHSEACSIFAGPYTVTHHKSTLLIASHFSFFNAGSGTNQSNHMYKLGPVHQGVLERGAKTGSMSYMLLPSRVSPFSVVIGKHFGNFDASDFPFSYITEEDGKSVLTPAMNLFTVGTKRDTEKWEKRDKRKSDKKLDKINFDFYSPYIVGKMVNAFEILDKFYEETPKENEYITYKGMHIPRLLLRTCKKYYNLGIKTGIGENLVRIINNVDLIPIEEMLKEINNISSLNTREKWLDIGGLFISGSDWIEIREKIVKEDIKSITQLNIEFEKINTSYNSSSWKWFLLLLKEKYSPDAEISKEILKKVIEDWNSSKQKLLNMTLRDAEKEFDSNSKIGYGIDGDEENKELDFNNVRGSYQENKFIIQLNEEIEKTNLETDKLLNLLN